MSTGTGRRVCIVTPDTIGPIKNGGIGTHSFYLARVLRAAGCEVTILFTGPVENKTDAHWARFYRELGIAFVSLQQVPELTVPLRTHWFVERSYRIYQYLRSQAFDVIHFQDWQANGFHCIQAKRTTSDFETTLLTVTMHSSTEWVLEGNQRWLDWPLSDAKLEWCERYCCTHADVLVSPSQHMLDWTTAHGWTLATDRRLIRYCYSGEAAKPLQPAQPGMIAFFGRLETRKGLEIFLGGLAALSAEERGRIGQVLFVGKNGLAGEISGTAAITAAMGPLKIPYELATDLDSASAIELLRSRSAVAFIPSLLDNYPFTVIECCMEGLPVMAARTGGIPEMLGDSALFAPTAKGVADALRRLGAGEVNFGAGFYDPAAAAAAWVALSNEAPPVRMRAGEAREANRTGQLLVSICVPYFNYGRYVEALLVSLKAQTYPHIEVIVVDDGSTEPASVATFDALARRFAGDPALRFVRKPNGGVGDTRNFAAGLSRGRYLVFMDADNVATPTMIEELLVAITKSQADVVTCHMKAFHADIARPGEGDAPLYGYAPVGAALEVGWLENVFGDANFIIDARVFAAIGGFRTERHTSWEDWDLLARLGLAGYAQEVVPRMLFWYRHTPEGFSRQTSLFHNHRRVLRAYTDALPPQLSRLVGSVATSYHYRFNAVQAQLTGQAELGLNDFFARRVGFAVERAVNRFGRLVAPAGSRRRETIGRLLRRR